MEMTSFWVLAIVFFCLSGFSVLLYCYRLRIAKLKIQEVMNRIDQLAYEKYRIYARLDSVNVTLGAAQTALTQIQRDLENLESAEALNYELQIKLKKKGKVERDLHRTIAAVVDGEDDVLELSLSHDLGKALMPQFPYHAHFAIPLDRCIANFAFDKQILQLVSLVLDDDVHLTPRDFISLTFLSARTGQAAFSSQVPVYSLSAIDLPITHIDHYFRMPPGLHLSQMRRRLQVEQAAWDEAVQRETEKILPASDDVRQEISELKKLKSAAEIEPASPPLEAFPELVLSGNTQRTRSVPIPRPTEGAIVVWRDDLVQITATKKVKGLIGHVSFEIVSLKFPIGTARTEIVNKDPDSCELRIYPLQEGSDENTVLQSLEVEIRGVVVSEIACTCYIRLDGLGNHTVQCLSPLEVHDFCKPEVCTEDRFDALWGKFVAAKTQVISDGGFALTSALMLVDKLYVVWEGTDEIRTAGKLETHWILVKYLSNQVEVRTCDLRLSENILASIVSFLKRYSGF